MRATIIQKPNSGKNLVVLLVGTAIFAGALSWGYRYATTHRATEFWGSDAARLIARSDRANLLKLAKDEITQLSPDAIEGKRLDLSHTRGMAHLRHAILLDQNYEWDKPVDPKKIAWRWCLMFATGTSPPEEACLLFSADFDAAACWDPDSAQWKVVAFGEMAESLQTFFEGLR